MILPINRLLRVDAVSGLGVLPPASIPQTVTSPPYDDAYRYCGYGWDRQVWKEVIHLLWRVTMPGGVVCWMVRGAYTKPGRMSTTPERQVLEFERAGFDLYEVIVAESSRGRPPERHHYRTATPIYIFSKGRPAHVDLRQEPNRHSGQRSGGFNFRSPVDNQLRGRRGSIIVGEVGIRGSVWYYPSGHNKTTQDHYTSVHPARMHEDLARDLILTYSLPGQLILDPFGGVGTTAKMAVLADRCYLSMEVCEVYHQIAKRRLRESHDRRNREIDDWLGLG